MPLPPSIEVVDSHTEGEPTRVVVGGWTEEVPGATMAERREFLRRHRDELRRAVVCEPRGHEAMVGALLTPPAHAGSLAGVVFFDNGGYLGMCGHGLIGVVRTLAFLGRVPEAERSRRAVRIDTPAGTVEAAVGAGAPLAAAGKGAAGRAAAEVGRGDGDDGDGESGDGDDADAVTVVNVPARCHAHGVALYVPSVGRVVGDIAYGGNWFFIVRIEDLDGVSLALDRLGPLTDLTRRIRDTLVASGITGEDGAEVDHIELVAPPSGAHADSRNFVLCPGGAYDRSPCGTGTSAMLATLHARGKLAIGQPWRQEGIAGGVFTAWLTREGDALVPHIRGRAYITGRGTLLFERRDPFREGFSAL